jgi:hypothetical protein
MYVIYDKGGVSLEYFYWLVMSWYRLELDIQLLRFELSEGCLYISYKKDRQSNLFLDSIEAQRDKWGPK